MTAAVRPLLVNDNEKYIDQALRESAEGYGYRVSPKVRVADVLAIDRSGLTNEEFSYALRSHFDWVVSDRETLLPEFAVEFDGDSHRSDEVRRRDALKDSICEKLEFPLLRIYRYAFRPALNDTVLGYLVDAWVGYKGFNEAQEAGYIPEDEIYMPWARVDAIDETTGLIMFHDLAGPARRLVYRLGRAGLLRYQVPWSATRSHAVDDREQSEAYAWVETADSKLVIGHVRIRNFSFPAVLPFELAEDLAHMDLGDRLARWREGDLSVPRDPAELPDFDMSWSGGGPGGVSRAAAG